MIANYSTIFHKLSHAKFRELLRFAKIRLGQERLPEVAGSLTFTTVLALVPMLTIALAIFTAFPLFNTFRTALEAYFIESLMPKNIANTILSYLNQFASKSRGVSAVGGIALIVTAAMMMAMIDRVFNEIWRVKTKRPLSQRIMVYWAIVTLGPLLIGISITSTSYLFKATNGVVLGVPLIGAVFYTLLSVLLTTGAFTLLYMAVPNRLIDWRDAAWGGLLAGIAFEIAKRLFAAYIVKFPTYTVVYGAIAAVPIFLIWIYLFWIITLMGALLAAALPVVKYERWRHVATPGSDFVDAMAILNVLFEARAYGASAEVDATIIRDKTWQGFDESEALLDKMLSVGWVGCIKTEQPMHLQWGKRITQGLDSWTLLANPEQLKVADVYRLFVFNTSNNTTLAKQVENAVERGLGQSLTLHFTKGLAE